MGIKHSFSLLRWRWVGWGCAGGGWVGGAEAVGGLGVRGRWVGWGVVDTKRRIKNCSHEAWIPASSQLRGSCEATLKSFTLSTFLKKFLVLFLLLTCEKQKSVKKHKHLRFAVDDETMRRLASLENHVLDHWSNTILQYNYQY